MSLDRELWEAVRYDRIKEVRAALRAGAGFTYTPGYGSRGEDALLRAIVSGHAAIIPLLLRKYPYSNPHADRSPVLAAVEAHGLDDATVLKVLSAFIMKLDEKAKGQLPLHAAMLRPSPKVALFLLSKRRVQKNASTTYKGKNALELLLSRDETLPKTWRSVAKTLQDLGLKVRSRVPINATNERLLGSK